MIASVDGRDVSMLTDSGLVRLLGTYEVGTRLEITFDRSGKRRAASVTVEPTWAW